MHKMTIEPGKIPSSFPGSNKPGEKSMQAPVSEIIPKVLVVDDELEVAEEVVELLTLDGFTRCEIACDPIQALDIIRNDKNISIIITDLKMPNLDGLEMISRIQKGLKFGRELAVIVITGHAGTREAIEALRLGAIDFITKPISPDHLLHAVGRASETLQLRKLDKHFREHLEFMVEERTQEVRILSDDLLRANRKLQSLNLELSASNRIKSEFLAMISHELRTPLVPIIGFAEIIAISSQARGDLEEHRYCKKISKWGDKLLRIINTILVLADVDSGDINLILEKVNIIDIVERVVSVLRPKAEAASITMTIIDSNETIPTIQGDKKRLMQAIRNVLDNAIQHCPPSTEVTIKVSNVKDGLSISVSDNGIGMSKEEVRVASEAFRQVDGGYTRSINGLGLGLPLAHIFVELHGGRLQITSSKGKGTRVDIVIPLGANLK